MKRSRFILDLFDEPWKPGDEERRKVDPEAGGGRRKPVAPKDPPRVRDPKTGEFVSVADYEREIERLRKVEHDNNAENAKRRTENSELKKDLKLIVDAHASIKARALRTEALAALTAAKVVDPDVVDVFLAWAGEKVKVGENMAVEGLVAAVPEFKTAKPKLFEDEGGGGGNGEPRVIDAESVKPNATAKGASPAGGGANGAPAVKLDFSKGSVDDIVAAYAESLR